MMKKPCSVQDRHAKPDFKRASIKNSLDILDKLKSIKVIFSTKDSYDFSTLVTTQAN